MADLTRRHALLTVASGVTALAGCAGEDDPTVDLGSPVRPVEDYEVRHVRNEDGALLFTTREEVPTGIDDERDRRERSSRRAIVSEDRLDEFTFGDVPEADRLRSFATATDFNTSSLYLLAMPVEACYEVRLRSATVDWDEFESDRLNPRAHFCRTYRPADVECSVDEVHTVGFAIRLPLTAERSSGSGRSMSSSCGPSPRREYFGASVTPADGGEDK